MEKPTAKAVRFTGEREARGRNGWFTPHDALWYRVSIGGSEPTAYVGGRAKQVGFTEPIILRLGSTDLRALAALLVEAADALGGTQ